ncbi:sterol desaturase family protein [Parafilimonas sp.]|uniref:sterol desaturase family protein n=1 Tax=Parafilimonas sp. TaxID=1969739 RepID=UPI0039E5C7F3
MKINILAFAIPVFAGFMLLEYCIAKRKKQAYFNLHNSIANISIGIAERLCDVLVTASFYHIYDVIQKKYGLFPIKEGLLLWILLLLSTDFLWYWYHRLAHEINLLWAVHVVHHQSEDYNFTVSARITVLQAFVRTGFWAVLPLIGFPAPMITTMLLIHGIYPFFIHTRLIGKLGILEYILVTPSHHRVHHASNEKYLDKNYGDVFIIWDKLFGTFQKEEEEPQYGLTKPLNTYSFLWQHFHFIAEIMVAVKSAKTGKEKIRVIFGRPANFDAEARKKAETIFKIHHVNQATMARPLNRYVIWQMIILLLLLFAFILFEAHLSVLYKISFTITIMLTLINCGAIMEQKRWIFHVELLRICSLLIIPFCYWYYPQTYSVSPALAAIASFIIIFYHSLEKGYLRLVYRNKK